MQKKKRDKKRGEKRLVYLGNSRKQLSHFSVALGTSSGRSYNGSPFHTAVHGLGTGNLCILSPSFFFQYVGILSSLLTFVEK